MPSYRRSQPSNKHAVSVTVLLATLITLPAVGFSQTIIDFGDFPEFTIIHDQYVPQGIRFSVDGFENAVAGPYIRHEAPSELDPFAMDFLCTNIVFTSNSQCKNDLEIRFVAPGESSNRVLVNNASFVLQGMRHFEGYTVYWQDIDGATIATSKNQIFLPQVQTPTGCVDEFFDILLLRETMVAPVPVGGFYIQNNTWGLPCGNNAFTTANFTFDPYVPPDPTEQERDDKDCPPNGAGFGNPCDASSGNKYQREVDLNASEIDLSIVRHYASASARDVGFGNGWTTRYHKKLEFIGSSVRVYKGTGSSEGFVSTSGTWAGPADGELELAEDASGFTVTLGNGDFDRYDLTGRLLSEQRRGKVTTFGYDGHGRLDSVIGPFGHSLSFVYNAANRVEAVTDPGGRTIQYAYDGIGNLTTVTYPDTTSRIYHYEDSLYPNALTGITDERGVRYATYGYDAVGRSNLTQHAETDNGAPQEKFSLTFDSDTQTTVVEPNGIAMTLTFNKNHGVNNLITSLNQADGKSVSQSFDADNNLSQVTDEEGRATRNIYNSDNQLSQVIEAEGTPYERTTTYGYLSGSKDLVTLVRQPSVVAGSLHDTTISYDTNLNLDVVTETGFQPDGTAVSRSTNFEYDNLGRLVRIDGPRTDVADITIMSYYDCVTGFECGDLQSVTNALGQVVNFNTYDANGRLTKMTDANGLVTEISYDTRGRLSVIVQTTSGGAARTTAYTYTAAGQLATETSPEGVVITRTYDAAQYLRSISDNLNNRIEFRYDLSGNRTDEEVYDPFGSLSRSMQTAYDIRNQVSATTELGFITQYVHDAVGNLDYIVDANSHPTDYQTDPLGRVFEVVDALTGLTQFEHDPHDNLIGATAPNGVNTQFSHDDFGNLIQEVSPDRGTITYAYDEAGNPLSKTDAKGIVVQYGYDALNRLNSVVYPSDTSANVAYFYDDNGPGQNGLGRLTQLTEQSGSITYDYDEFGNVKVETRTLDGVMYETRYAYNRDNQLTQIIYPSGRIVNYDRNSIGRVSTITTKEDAAAGLVSLATNIEYRPFGPIAELQYGNGQHMTIAHDQAYQTKGIDTQSVIATVQDLTYGLDPVGNIRSIANNLDAAESQVFLYDELDRLDTAQGSYGSRDFDYDPTGNRIQLLNGSVTTSYSYSPGSNRLATTDDINDNWTYSYDANGNMISKLAPDGGGWLYSYNARNRLANIVQRVMVPRTKGNGPPRAEDSVVASYVYNVLGQRVLKSTDAGTTTYLYGLEGNLLAEADEQGSVAVEYIYLDGLPIAMQRITTVPTEPPIAEDFIVDNGDIGTTFVGTWNALSSNKDFGADHLRADGGTGSTYTWTPSLGSGDYEVSAWWASKKNYSDNVPYTLIHNGQQSFLSADHSNNGNQWNLLGTFTFAGDGSDSLQVSDANGKTIADAVRFTKVATPPPPQTVTATYFIHFDHLGTPKRLTDAAGAVVWAMNNSPFGTGSSNNDVDGDGTPVTMNLRFAGQYSDSESGLNYNYHRTYDPSTGRYLESDPIGLGGGLNTYGYVGGNPLSYVDPYGLERIRECIHKLLGSRYQEYEDKRQTFLYSFNWPGAEIGIGPGLDPGPRGRGPIRPQPDVVPTRVWVDKYDVWRVDVYNVTKTWDDMEVLCQSWEVDECTGEADYSTLTEGRHQYRQNEKMVEALINSYKKYNRFRIRDSQ